MKSPIRFAFFGTPQLAVAVLDELERAGLSPALVITAPDKPSGRGLTLKASEVKEWANARHIPCLQPKTLDTEIVVALSRETWDVFVVAAYGKILPQTLLDIPAKGVLNVHPSLLPRLRGPSPISSAILEDEKEIGVSVMLLDAQMDHGPVVAQEKVEIPEWPIYASTLEALLARKGGALLAHTLPQWISGAVEAKNQNHAQATYCKKITKEMGYIDLSRDPYQNLLKIRGLDGWPGAWTYFERSGKRLRVVITAAHLEGTGLTVDSVIPEGKREMPYADFLRSGATPAPIDNIS